MLAVLDIGNAEVTVGVFAADKLETAFSLATDLRRPAEEYAFILGGLLAEEGLAREDIDGAAISSVVPPLTACFEQVAQRLFRCHPVVAGAGTRSGVHVATHNPREVGTDRILNAAAARHLYGAPLIVVDFGTATSFDLVGVDGSYLGSATAPGLAVGAEALFGAASILHRVTLCRPRSAIGKDATSAMQAGIIYGHVAMVEGMVQRIRTEYGQAIRTIVATGPQAPLIAAETSMIDHVEPHLTLIGLRLLYELNADHEAAP